MSTASKEDLEKIRFNIEFSMAKKTNFVMVELWYTHSDMKTINFIKGLGTLLNPILGDVWFYPRFVTYACEKCTFSFKQ